MEQNKPSARSQAAGNGTGSPGSSCVVQKEYLPCRRPEKWCCTWEPCHCIYSKAFSLPCYHKPDRNNTAMAKGLSSFLSAKKNQSTWGLNPALSKTSTFQLIHSSKAKNQSLKVNHIKTFLPNFNPSQHRNRSWLHLAIVCKNRNWVMFPLKFYYRFWVLLAIKKKNSKYLRDKPQLWPTQHQSHQLAQWWLSLSHILF